MSDPLAPPPGSPADTAATFLEGLVIRATGSWYDVQAGEQVIPSKVRGRFRLEESETTSPVVVGDRVTIRLNEDGTGLITEIHPRRNELKRRAAGRRVGLVHVLAANIDAAWVVQSIRLPKINPGFIDRFLVMAERDELPAGIVFNKLDLMKPADRDAVFFLRDLYAGLGYPVLMTSVKTGEGLDAFAAALRGRVSVVAGPSGVGKSSLLNAVEPGLNLRIGEVSRKTKKGRHTTTYAALYPLSSGGFVVDTPGLREFGLVDLEPAELGHYFVEFRPFLPACHFPDCTHDHEPGCAVKEAVARDEITPERYESYLNILYSLHLGEKDVGR
ncbi:ribosome small subunit-dependent GTPase A [Rhodocaloribacter litoris]|uniref:ribosome small subunit-dependent GTPase A n=1 Tax=Rhodocaloribacter litoris TaxID=2558931 RepID=UPI0014246110|nr:ribosome small subunit-dependent GTPase A [Rhodocaloribacter litoris]QXD15695.1 ribosome small subunit-dependent GTPase A [Rhodocaloribacter litoris]GIV61631.1 MAG: putative ribosome biogenesis GTPase RsgA [Rhodothermaceae bacterium]